MRKLMYLILTLFLTFTVINAQATTGWNPNVKAGDSELVLEFRGTVDSLGGDDSVVTSTVFDIEDYDSDVTNFTVYYLLTCDDNTGDTPKLDGILYASEDNVTYTATTDTLLNSVTAETAVWSTFTIQSGARAGYYKLQLENESSGSGTDYVIKIRSPKKDYKVN